MSFLRETRKEKEGRKKRKEKKRKEKGKKKLLERGTAFLRSGESARSRWRICLSLSSTRDVARENEFLKNLRRTAVGVIVPEAH